MTVIQRTIAAKVEKMDGTSKEDSAKSARPVRNRRYTRLEQCL